VREAFFAGDPTAVTADGKANSKFVRKKLALYETSCPPIDLSRLTVELIGECIIARNANREEKIVKSTLRGWISAIKDLFRSYDARKPDAFEDRVEKFAKGYAKDAATSRSKNGSGKDALPFELLCELSRGMLMADNKEYAFARAFMLIQWNLMCRSNNVEDLMLAHLQWADDHMLVYFRKQKNDQDGSRSQEPRSVYANPVKLRSCSWYFCSLLPSWAKPDSTI
jgi:hypothetical protein